mmetsp:Transcript_28977/g.53503  ORF Transcript_28977/g.53503 Transcript_28977/m.53503 type:complete len:365 (-) Transcript_28977:30-1124(-)
MMSAVLSPQRKRHAAGDQWLASTFIMMRRRRGNGTRRILISLVILFGVILFGVWIILIKHWNLGRCPTITGGTKVAIVTLNTGDASQLYEKAMNNHQSYAMCHEYDFFNAAELLDKNTKSVHPYMQKAYALQLVMHRNQSSEYEYIIWIDRDAIFLNHKMSIPQRLQELNANTQGTAAAEAETCDGGYDLLIAVESWAWLNSGVLIFRNTPFSAKLVDDWIGAYHTRKEYYDSSETIMIQGTPKHFRDLFGPNWSCEDQGALIALLAGYDATVKWNTDKYDGLGKPHSLHQGHSSQWAALSSRTLLAPKYQSKVRIVTQEWFNTNPWDDEKHESTDPFIFHFNGQQNKPKLIEEYSKQVTLCNM